MTQYDYRNQAWIVDGRYVACEHPERVRCRCYGTAHAGQVAEQHEDVQPQRATVTR